MTLQVEFTYVVSVLIVVLGAFWGMAKMLLAQSQRHIEVDYRIIKGANHFFEDKMDVLTTTISGYLQKSVAPPLVKKAAAVSG